MPKPVFMSGCGADPPAKHGLVLGVTTLAPPPKAPLPASIIIARMFLGPAAQQPDGSHANARRSAGTPAKFCIGPPLPLSFAHLALAH